MELFGIALSLPVAFVLTVLYRPLFEWISAVFRPASCIVCGLFAAEITMLAIFGAVRSRALAGPTFTACHAIVLLLGTPAFANLLVLQNPSRPRARWQVVVPHCTLFGFTPVMLQYGVSEQIHGIEAALETSPKSTPATINSY